MTTYAQKSSATRAAKKLHGEGWAETHSISPTDDGKFEITAKGQALQSFLANHDADEKAKKAKAIEIKARHEEELKNSIPAAPEAPKAPESIDPSTLVLSHEDKCPGCGICLENGISDFDGLIDIHGSATAAYEFQQRENACMACWFQWGAAVEVGNHAGQAAADRQANAALVNVDPAKPKMSTAAKPTKLVWQIADDMNDAAKAAGLPAPTRSEVQAECVKRGIAYGTARTQYQHWFKCMNDSKATPIATIGKDGKIVPPTVKA